MNKDDISALIAHEIFAEMEVLAANNGLSRTFDHYNPLMIAVIALASLRVTNMLIEKKIIEADQPGLFEDPDRPVNPVGKLNTPFGLKGYLTADVGATVYERIDRYFIILISETGGENKVVPFYKETLASNIDFFNT